MRDYSMTNAERNRAIKKILTGMFGNGTVTVTGGRGTSWGWVRINIAYRPLDQNESADLQKKIWEAFRAAGLDKTIGSYDTADYGSGREIHIQFKRPRYRLTQLHQEPQLLGVPPGALGPGSNAPLPAAVTPLNGLTPDMVTIADFDGFSNEVLACFCRRWPGTNEARAAKAALVQRRSLPYGSACREPWKCINKGYCPRDPNCAD